MYFSRIYFILPPEKEHFSILFPENHSMLYSLFRPDS